MGQYSYSGPACLVRYLKLTWKRQLALWREHLTFSCHQQKRKIVTCETLNTFIETQEATKSLEVPGFTSKWLEKASPCYKIPWSSWVGERFSFALQWPSLAFNKSDKHFISVLHSFASLAVCLDFCKENILTIHSWFRGYPVSVALKCWQSRYFSCTLSILVILKVK